MDKYNGIIVIDNEKILTEEDLLIRLLNIYKIDDILNVKLDSEYFDNPKEKDEFILNVKNNNDNILKYLIVVDRSEEIVDTNNTYIISIVFVIILILFIIISMVVAKIRIHKKKNDFLKK